MHYEQFQNGTVKCIEDEIPFEVPEGWAWCRLKQIGNIVGGGTPKTNIDEYWNGNIPWISPTDLSGYTDMYISCGARKITEKGLYKSSAQLMPKGTILYSSRAPIGYVAIAKNTITTNQGFKSVVPYIGIISEYIYYCLIARTENIVMRATGTTFKEISGSQLAETLIPIPPSLEQLEISKYASQMLENISYISGKQDEMQNIIKLVKNKILDLAIRGKLVPQDTNDEPASVLLERIRLEKEELIKQGKIKRDKRESIIFKGEDNSYYETVANITTCIDDEIPFDLPYGWTWCRLKSLAAPHENSFVDGPFGSDLKTEHYTENREVRIIQLNNIGEFSWKNNGVKYTTFNHAETLERCKSYPGDIVIAKMMPAGRAIIIPDIENVYVISSDCVRLQLSNYINNDYIMYMINSPIINKFILQTVQGIGRTRTSLSKLKELLIPLPPYNQQLRITAILKKAFKYIDIINNLSE